MKKFIILALILGIAVTTATILIKHNNCHVADNEAVKITKDFCGKIGVVFNSEPGVLKQELTISGKILSLLLSVSNNDISVVTRGRHGFEQSLDINCAKEVVRCTDSEQKLRVFKRYNISLDNRSPRKWPPLLSESMAKKIILSYSNIIGIPKDVEFSKMWLDDGVWTSSWKRTLNGNPYEDDSISIAIMAIDGEFYSYGKRFLGKPCPTEVKVTKEEAIKKGWKKVSKSFGWGEWGKFKNEYEVKSAELLIVQPNTFIGFIVPWKSSRSRLAWVISYGLIKEPEDQKRIEIGYHDRFVIKIDAANKNILGGETGIYR